ncbi:DDE-type integrase/transposase/recombinase [Mycolicibacterium murale]|nr:DDE-type integrase/transposase/recombinase [Mycolicibacterium murale]MCV7182957.1 DDE-type integrase/transposase/recombinase [Mycolicibacterium murale]
MVAAVLQARGAGSTWQDIWQVLGVSRQAAFQRYGKPVDPRNGGSMNTSPLPDAIDLARQVLNDHAHGRWGDITERFDQSARPSAPTRAKNTAPRAAPVLKATGPQQIWSWDITDLRSPWRGVAFKAYSIIDIYSRKIVGWRVEERECDDLAVEMFETAFGGHGLPAVVHADSGPAMRSTVLADLLAGAGVGRTHNRPHVSNDNPYSESEFRTMKYRPNFPGVFDDLETARAWVDTYVRWYNQHHRHSGIALFTPEQVHTGAWSRQWDRRDHALQNYYNAHPERFRARPHTKAPSPVVGINLPAENGPDRLHAA